MVNTWQVLGLGLSVELEPGTGVETSSGVGVCTEAVTWAEAEVTRLSPILGSHVVVSVGGNSSHMVIRSGWNTRMVNGIGLILEKVG
eukprot:g47360.t1